MAEKAEFEVKSLALIIPAWNEQELLPSTLLSVRNAFEALPASLRKRLIVVDNNSTDRTAEVAREGGAEVVFEAVNQIARARNAGAEAAADCDMLIFLDADTKLNGALLQESFELIRSGKICGGGGRIIFEGKLPLYARLLHFLWDCLSVFIRCSAGAYIFCRRDDFDSTGGFDERVYAAEDVLLSRALKRDARKRKTRRRFLITRGAVLTSARKFRWHGSFSLLWILFKLALNPMALRKKEKLGFWYER